MSYVALYVNNAEIENPDVEFRVDLGTTVRLCI